MKVSVHACMAEPHDHSHVQTCDTSLVDTSLVGSNKIAAFADNNMDAFFVVSKQPLPDLPTHMGSQQAEHTVRLSFCFFVSLLLCFHFL